jgi:hypothetical protein
MTYPTQPVGYNPHGGRRALARVERHAAPVKRRGGRDQSDRTALASAFNSSSDQSTL